MITTLPETYGRVVELRVCQDRSVRQTAQQLNISPSNVTTRLNRAIKMIKGRLHLGGGIGTRFFLTRNFFVAPEFRIGLRPLVRWTVSGGYAF